MAAEAESRRIVLLGPPNSGKGTQAEILARRLGIPWISTGVMLREARDAGSDLGRRVADLLAAGQLVDDATMADLIRERLGRRDTGNGFLLDGYPRTPGQAETLEVVLGEAGLTLDAVVLIQVPEEVLVRRALGRGREDDREEVVRERIRIYQEKTAPLIGYYRKLSLLEEVDGDLSIGEVTAQILSVLGEPAETTDGQLAAERSALRRERRTG